MPPKKAPPVLCRACLVLKAAHKVVHPHFGLHGGFRCSACKKARRARQWCVDCHLPLCCRPYPVVNEWRCLLCSDKRILLDGSLPKKHTHKWDPLDIRDYLVVHAELGRPAVLPGPVDFWIVPSKPSCFYLMARLIFWRRFGVVVGLLPGPPEGTCRWLNGIWNVNRIELGLHFRELCDPGGFFGGQAGWPRANTPILVVGATQLDLNACLPEFHWGFGNPAGNLEHARLVAFPQATSLSEHGTTADWRRQAFHNNPHSAHPPYGGGHNCELTARCRLAIQTVGLPVAEPLNPVSQPGARGGAFRTLYSGSRWPL